MHKLFKQNYIFNAKNSNFLIKVPLESNLLEFLKSV